MDELARVLLTGMGTERKPVRLEYGTVTDDSPLAVTVGAATTSTLAEKLTSYSPTIGDYVAVLVAGEDRLVIGEVG